MTQCMDCEIVITVGSVRCSRHAAIYRWTDPVERAKHSKAAKKACQNDHTIREKLSIAAKAAHTDGIYDSTETREKKSRATKSAYARGAYDSPETRKKRSDNMKARWASGNGPSRITRSNLEIDVCGVLEDYGFNCTPQYKPDNIGWTFDILLVDYNIVVEVDGDYWHYSERAVKQGMSERDARKDDWLVNNGYTVIRLPESVLKRQGIEQVIEEYVLPAADEVSGNKLI